MVKPKKKRKSYAPTNDPIYPVLVDLLSPSGGTSPKTPLHFGVWRCFLLVSKVVVPVSKVVVPMSKVVVPVSKVAVISRFKGQWHKQS